MGSLSYDSEATQQFFDLLTKNCGEFSEWHLDFRVSQYKPESKSSYNLEDGFQLKDGFEGFEQLIVDHVHNHEFYLGTVLKN